MEPKVYYAWKLPVDEEGVRELYTPWADPRLYEYPFDFMFDSPEDAVKGLEEWGAYDEAKADGWVLVRCEQVEVPVEF